MRPADEPKGTGSELLFNVENDIQEGGLFSPGREQRAFRADSKEESLDKMFVGNDWRGIKRK